MSKVEIWKVYTGSMDEVGIIVTPFPVDQGVVEQEAEKLAGSDDIQLEFIGVGIFQEPETKPTDFAEFMDEVRELLKGNQQRLGQQMFNLAEQKADLHNLVQEIRGTDKDPFYKNRNIPRFIKHLWGREKAIEFVTQNKVGILIADKYSKEGSLVGVFTED